MNKPDYGRASKIIKALIQGTNPVTGDPLPTDNILNSADVLRAMLVAASSIEDAVGRANRRAQLPGNVGRSWSKEEEATMVAAFNAKEPIPHIANRHGRTIRAIEARLERLGLLKPEDRVTNNSFVSSPPSGTTEDEQS